MHVISTRVVFWAVIGACLTLLVNLPAVVQAQWNYTTNSGAITIKKYTGAGGAVIIPDTINALPVATIGSNAFQACFNLTSITIPSSVTNIGNWAFASCFNLTSVTMFDGIVSLGNYAFYRCPNLSGITIPDSVVSLTFARNS